MFKRVITLGSQPNSTFDLYIQHRLPVAKDIELVQVNPWSDPKVFNRLSAKDSLVIINRYTSLRMMRWLRMNRNDIYKLLYVIDDDLTGMLRASSVPTKNKVRPFQTRFLQKQLLKIVDEVYVSTQALADVLGLKDAIVVPPLDDIQRTSARKLDGQHMCYFAKMHRPEHDFLRPIVRDVLEQNPTARFTVIAGNSSLRKWQNMERVNVLPEQSLSGYRAFAANCNAGIFLIPLLDSKLNKCRSSAKRIEAVQMGAAPVFSDMPAYRDPRGKPYAGEVLVENTAAAWTGI